MSKSKYAAAKGRSGTKKSPPFIRLDLKLYDSPAYQDLSFHARALLTAMQRQFNGYNNGSLIMPFALAMKCGFSNERTFYATLKALKTHGFIEQTRPAQRRGRPCAARYALTFENIDEPESEFPHDAVPSDTPTDDWKNWTPEATGKSASQKTRKRPAKLPAKNQEATGKTASYVPAILPAIDRNSEEATGEIASHRPVFGDLRPADLPVDLRSTMGGCISPELPAAFPDDLWRTAMEDLEADLLDAER